MTGEKKSFNIAHLLIITSVCAIGFSFFGGPRKFANWTSEKQHRFICKIESLGVEKVEYDEIEIHRRSTLSSYRFVSSEKSIGKLRQDFEESFNVPNHVPSEPWVSLGPRCFFRWYKNKKTGTAFFLELHDGNVEVIYVWHRNLVRPQK